MLNVESGHAAPTSPRHVGGRTQRLLRMGEVTHEELREDWVRRYTERAREARDGEPLVLDARSRVRYASQTSRGDGMSHDAWKAKHDEEARQAARRRQQQQALEEAKAEAKAEARALRNEEARERLERHQEVCGRARARAQPEPSCSLTLTLPMVQVNRRQAERQRRCSSSRGYTQGLHR